MDRERRRRVGIALIGLSVVFIVIHSVGIEAFHFEPKVLGIHVFLIAFAISFAVGWTMLRATRPPDAGSGPDPDPPGAS